MGKPWACSAARTWCCVLPVHAREDNEHSLATYHARPCHAVVEPACDLGSVHRFLRHRHVPGVHKVCRMGRVRPAWALCGVAERGMSSTVPDNHGLADITFTAGMTGR